MPDEFACGCSEEQRTEAEGWLREALPGLEPDEEKILTGRRKHYRVEDQNGKVYEGEYEEHKESENIETLLVSLDELAQKHGGTFRFSVATDQWCGLYVEFKKYEDKEPVRRVSIHYDFGLLPHALAKALLIFEEELTDDVPPGV